ncbi:MAG: c-type cytochrome [Gammaproteobacteria bacterium]|nr:c-type cytochrome [Gammaproteobacteria bacterium]MDH5729931.1 c-type cytochrome [Gammaproteobacteria bacterium]
MKLFPVLITTPIFLFYLMACTDKASESMAKSESKNFAEAIMLARNNGCLKCHQLKAPLVGPPWHAVADRYRGAEDARNFLIEKVKRGGSGNWDATTGGAQMPANSPRVSDAHIAAIVDFILSLKHGDS